MRNNENRLLVFFGLILSSALAFEAGFLYGVRLSPAPIVISIPEVKPLTHEEETGKKDEKSNEGAIINNTVPSSGSCPLVGSRNSNKYHVVTCAVVKRIKPENKICFASEDEAKKRGYVAGCMK